MNKIRSLHISLLSTALLALPAMLDAQQAKPLTLKQAIELAHRNSLEVASAQVRYNVAVNTARVNASAFRPNVYTGSGAAFTHGFPQTPSGAAPSIVNVTYVQTVYNPSLRGQLRASDERADAQRIGLDRIRNAVTVETSSKYLELGKVRHSLELARSQRQSYARISNFTRERVAEGLEL